MPSSLLPTLSVQQLFSFVAIQRTQQGDEVLRQLVLHAYVIGPVEQMQDVDAVRALLREMFGLDLPRSRVQSAFDYLVGQGHLTRNAAGQNDLSSQSREAVNGRILAAAELAQRVRTSWLAELTTSCPELDPDLAWKALDRYLAEAFRRHGMFTVALLDPKLEVPSAYQESMTVILDGALTEACPQQQRAVARDAVVGFLARAHTDPDRTAYIVQLADAAFSYFALSAPPEVAARLREHLKPLTLFFDTNVLFGIVGLDEPTRAATIADLFDTLAKERFPYRTRYHERTERELRKTLDSVATSLKSYHWPPGVSRAAASSPNVPTIARLYHQRNAARPLTAITFFEPFEHIDVLLDKRGVKLYRDAGTVPEQRIYDLIAEYNAFLAQYKRQKPYESVDHDMRVLDCVRRLRSKAPSSLDAAALLVTFDFPLFRFDWLRSRQTGEYASAVLPNQLLQLLRPFLTASPDFDRSFAATFAFPEFRSLDHRSSVAAARMLEVVAAYQDIPEETVASLLANTMLLDQSRGRRSTSRGRRSTSRGRRKSCCRRRQITRIGRADHRE